jgi:hypothetical protein
VVALAVVILQSTVVRASRDGVRRLETLGHQRASLRQMRLLVNVLAPESHLVEEDASVDTLLRAAIFGRRAFKPLGIVARDRRAVLDAMTRGPVYAFAIGQRELSLRGFVIEPLLDPSRPTLAELRGLARVTGTRACADVGTTWVDLDGIGAAGRIALSTSSAKGEGPVLAYFSGSDAYLPGPDGWPARALRGFDARILGRRTPEAAADLEAEAMGSGLSGDPVFAAPFVARLFLYRTPEAPLALPIVLGPPRSRGVARLVADYPGALPLTLCDAPPIRVVEF